MKKIPLISLILILALLLPAAVSATGSDAALSPRIEASHHMEAMPDHWNPMKDLSAEAQLILDLTASGLYSLSSDGKTLVPNLAEAMPEDATAEFAGTYGIPADATRGYAFRIRLDKAAKWESGIPITTIDILFTLHKMVEEKRVPLELSGLQDYYSGTQKAAGSVLSLKDAGFRSVEEAENAGYSLFYVDTTNFWGLDYGWVAVSDRTRLKDTAIPSGVTEMYLSGAYLYDRYLRTGTPTDMFQREFVGICDEMAHVTLEDVGIIQENAHSFVLILSQSSTPEFVALRLRNFFPLPEDLYADNYATSAKSYRSCGPYRILSATEEAILLEPNPYWTGKTQAFRADLIRLEIGA
jgi:ABC-type oligopeptide transport system substrate-binding subunit